VKELLAPTNLSTIFEKMSQDKSKSNYFGSVDNIDSTLEIDLGKGGYVEPRMTVFLTSDQLVGIDPDDDEKKKKESDKTVTSLVTILLNDIDNRFIKSDKVPESFEPFQGTQIDHDAVVLQYPRSTFDFLLGPTRDQNMEYEEDEADEALIVSQKTNVQNKYEALRNKYVSITGDYNKVWRYRLCLKFKHNGKPVKMDFSLTDPTSRRGEVDYEFCDGPKPICKFEIALTPEDKDGSSVPTKKLKKKTAQDKFKKFEARRRKSKATDDDSMDSEY